MADISVSTEAGAVDMSFETQSDLSALQYYFVKMDSSELVVACGANEKPLGILQNAPLGTAAAPKLAQVRLGGVSKLKIAEGVAFGKFLTSTAGSKGEVCDAAGEEYGAKALSSGDTDDLISVLVVHGEVEASDA